MTVPTKELKLGFLHGDLIEKRDANVLVAELTKLVHSVPVRVHGLEAANQVIAEGQLWAAGIHAVFVGVCDEPGDTLRRFMTDIERYYPLMVRIAMLPHEMKKTGAHASLLYSEFDLENRPERIASFIAARAESTRR